MFFWRNIKLSLFNATIFFFDVVFANFKQISHLDLPLKRFSKIIKYLKENASVGILVNKVAGRLRTVAFLSRPIGWVKVNKITERSSHNKNFQS